MNPMINLSHLQFFCDAVAYGSISEAAKKNFVTQSAISQAIKKLETIFQTKLIFQNRHKLQLTDEGQILYSHSSKIFMAMKDTFEEIHRCQNKLGGFFKFIMTKSLSMSFFAPLYRTLRNDLPDITFKFRMGGLTLSVMRLKG